MDPDVILFLILALIVLFCFTIFALLSYSGLFHEPTVTTGGTPWSKSTTIVYKLVKGAYNSNNLGATFTEVTSIAPKSIPIGIFYDDPRKKKPSRLRCAIGCIVKERSEDGSEIARANDEEMRLFHEKEFKKHTLPDIESAVLSEFLYTTPLSIWMAPNRVYPRLNAYIEERSLCAYPLIEVYKDSKILYVAPLSKQEDFSVPECSAADEDEDEEAEALENENSAIGEVDVSADFASKKSGSDDSSFEEITATEEENHPPASTRKRKFSKKTN